MEGNRWKNFLKILENQSIKSVTSVPVPNHVGREARQGRILDSSPNGDNLLHCNKVFNCKKKSVTNGKQKINLKHN